MMDRDPPKSQGVLTVKPNGRKHLQQPFGTRKPAQKSKYESKENNYASDNSATSSVRPSPSRPLAHKLHQSESRIARPTPNHGTNRSISTTPTYSPPRPLVSPHDSRIPRAKSATPYTAFQLRSPSTNSGSSDQASPMRRPMDMNAAFRRATAQVDEEMNSESDDTFNMRQAFNAASGEINGINGIDGSPSPAPRSYRCDSYGTIPRRTVGLGPRKDGDLNSHLRQFDRNHQLAGNNGPLNGLFTNKSRVGPKVSETGKVLAKKASSSSIGSSPEVRRTKAWDSSPKEEVKKTASPEKPAIAIDEPDLTAEDIPIPTIEYESASDGPHSPMARHAGLSPDKSMNWHLDADFTAGDLQMTASPRVGLGQATANAAPQSSVAEKSPALGTPIHRRSNTRLDQIREREVEAAKEPIPEYESTIPQREETPSPKREASPDQRQINRLDEIRAREMESLSRRAVASSRLDEIRMKNSEARSVSPKIQRVPGRSDARAGSVEATGDPIIAHHESVSDSELKGEDGPYRPATKSNDQSGMAIGDSAGNHVDTKSQGEQRRSGLARTDSHELLQALARATSSSPAGEKSEKPDEAAVTAATTKLHAKQLSEDPGSGRARPPRGERSLGNTGAKSSRERPSVGFAGLKKAQSSDSVYDKRASFPNSDIDPTDRIEAEMSLFAPLDNYSEKGSMRAPSPNPSEKLSEPPDEETPRPNKPDPLTLPTPRVTGAYVDTPVTIRVKTEHERSRSGSLSNDLLQVPNDFSPHPTDCDLADFPKGGAKRDVVDRKEILKRSVLRSSSAPSNLRRRARSSSSARRPLLNSAKPPSVRDDIRAIMRDNQIDDSTLENLDSMLASHKVDDEELKQMITDTSIKIDDELKQEHPVMTDRERELEAYDRMSKSLRTGLLGIRSAKKGIERLEDKVTHTEQKEIQAQADLDILSLPSSTRPTLLVADQNSVMINVPMLYRTKPKFRLTRFGILTLLFCIWYAVESTFCFYYAGPIYECTPAVPCTWSPSEPYFPYTMPFMLDEWATGGRGRALVWRVGEEVGDVIADVSDWVTNTDLTQLDERFMNVWERKRHRRRLRKYGLVQKWIEPPNYQPRYPAWRAQQLERQRREELGLEPEEETMDADEQIRW
ncbi:hypothetical protein F5Y15DRAFT_260252 [Xylariaceae sp. FL0016]|nr:hypothetical protein F5Y15DRAFT_260252 [Xylariaceae sp. FL0016]